MTAFLRLSSSRWLTVDDVDQNNALSRRRRRRRGARSKESKTENQPPDKRRRWTKNLIRQFLGSSCFNAISRFSWGCFYAKHRKRAKQAREGAALSQPARPLSQSNQPQSVLARSEVSQRVITRSYFFQPILAHQYFSIWFKILKTVIFHV